MSQSNGLLINVDQVKIAYLECESTFIIIKCIDRNQLFSKVHIINMTNGPTIGHNDNAKYVWVKMSGCNIIVLAKATVYQVKYYTSR